uniref:Uncharacterized protein n=1 Tax=Pyrodinium bahamense TaxID=73915 RepID=A0A7S0FN85_9DINO|mmetsp:Transcript_3942/g.10855  ORF Transcript_3942/g.10855 Transcript_3942/m.10855 type:complete len:588 (+) Transcript_3942:91-1854(+)|eukprot:CAMPEP_0179049944 /NCGR_PEP_ID=MMETSP0796-20121207/20474_1 /TAXON_ID=73915 /ORGANISM="Pyrodinium bahamense, Strain pbaha01" /LENGTH=587 /DNA_ID=CAMNT_0020746437 /DNA_START=87 /DNA_END=1850 /DNA_ORIENTATION=-
MASHWEVVGGADKGGILVREGRGTDTKQLPERLSTGALVEELELVGDRLSYKLVTGSGPSKGWISIRIAGKVLARKLDADKEGEDQETEGEDLTVEQRCARELAKPGTPWHPIDMGVLQANHEKKAKGMIYGLEFPWTGQLLQEMGPKWLTKAFRAAATLPKGNSVTKIKDIKEHIGGGNCAKIAFEVEYAEPSSSLHTKLFAKIPFPMVGKTASDRMASSVMQQGSDIMEINASRLLESRLPFPIPKYYYGDVSNETTNWIQITERIPFGEKVGDRQFDPAYDKMKDWELKGTAEEYYYLLIKVGAQMAGAYKAERLASFEELHKFWDSPEWRGPEMWGMGPHNTGLGDSEFKSKIKMGADFIAETAKAIFPAHCTTPDFIRTYKQVLATVNSYTAEISYWCNRDKDYIAWSHGNLNVDNVFFWRDAEKSLNVGVLDWGGARCDSMGWKLWWWLYCCEYDYLNAHLDGMLECFIAEYQARGGPLLDKEELRMQFILSALSQGVGLLGAVPQIYRMCAKKHWPTIADRRDERIQQNVDGKNTLRVYIGTFINICNMIHDWDIPNRLEKWVEDFTAMTGMPRKSIEVA